MSIEKPKRKRCANKGCRRLAIGAGISNLCIICEEESLDDSFPGLQQLTEVEAERWARMDAEIRNAGTGIELRKLGKELAAYKETERLRRDAKEEEKRRQSELKRQEAWNITQAALKDGFDRKQIEIDKEINELRNIMQQLGKSYEENVVALAKKYKVDRKKMLIDPETRVIRETEL